jgi:multimeric flavodoxin WrbA
LDGDYVVCPWHNWKFHRVTGLGEPGYEDDAVPSHEVKVENGRVLVRTAASTPRKKKPHAPHPLSRPVKREPGAIRVVGISATAQDTSNPRYSTSEALLEVALTHAATKLGCNTRLIKLAELKFRACEGYYSKSARACTWPCSITQMDDSDQLTEVYEALVHWGDVVLLATPIRWGQAGSLYFRMAERLNCVQNQITIKDVVLIRNKVAGFIITGGQDNIQGVAGQLLGFFSELGFYLPQFPFVAHSRGWTAEDMEQNIAEVQKSEELREGTRALVERAVETARGLLQHDSGGDKTPRGGRKAHRLEVERAADKRAPS